MKPILILLLLVVGFSLPAQNARIDSLKAEVQSATGNDRILALAALAEAYRDIDINKMKQLSLDALELAEKNDFTLGLVNVYTNLGIADYMQNDLNSAEQNFRKALSAANRLKDEKSIARINNNLGMIRWRFGDYQAALNYYEKSIQAKEKLHDEKGVLNTLINTGLIAIEMGNYHKANDILDSSLEMAQDLKDNYHTAQIYNYKAQSYSFLGDYDKALEFITKALEIYQQGEYSSETAQLQNNIAVIYFELGDYEKAMEFSFKALVTFEKSGNELEIARIYNNLGNAYYQLKDLDQALEYHNISLNKRRTLNLDSEIENSLNNIGQVYEEKEDYPTALNYYLESLEINKRLNNKWNIANISNNLGKLYIAIRVYDSADYYLEMAAKIAEEIKARKLLMENYLHRYRLHKARGDVNLALEYYQNYTSLKDSLFSQESNEKIADINARYELNKYEKEKLLLNKNLELAKRNRELYIFALFFLVLLLVFFLLYNLQRAKTNKKLRKVNDKLKKAKLIAEENSSHLTLINKMLRHDLANNFVAILSGLNIYRNESQKEILDKVSSVCHNSINLIRNLKEITPGAIPESKLSIITADSILEQMKTHFPEINIDIEMDCNIVADDSILSVFQNIIENAYKHGQADQIDVTIRNFNSLCEIKIANNGKNIPAEIKGRIFEENFSYGETGQTGMGLYLVRQNILRYGASIHIEDRIPQGVIFVMNFKRRPDRINDY